MALKAGTKAAVTNGYAGSMAEAMENAFFEEWPNVMGSQPVPQSNDQMKLLFIAIAKGVVRHLQSNPGSFIVGVSSGGGPLTGSVTTIHVI